MPTINLTQNFNNVFDTLQREKKNITAIAKSMGYTSSNQLHSVIKGESMLSTKAITALIMNANVNPTYLFLGTGDMFLTDETEIEKLRKENQEWIHRHSEAVKTVLALTETVMKLEKRNADLIDISSAAIKYHKEHKEDETITEEEK
jgi:hypothetical protein